MIFMPLAANECVRGIVLSICECFCTFVHLASRISFKQWVDFHQTLVDNVVEVTDELIRFEGRGSKARSQQGQIFE